MRQWVSAVALAAGMSMPAQADVLFRFSGVVTGITTQGSVPLHPFVVGQSVLATLLVPWITDKTGAWEIVNGRFFFDGNEVPLGPNPGWIQFGDVPGQKPLVLGIGQEPTPLRGVGATITYAHFCCHWTPDVKSDAGEDGEAYIGSTRATGVYLANSAGNLRATATATGTLTARVIVPEPATWTLLGAGLLGMAAVRRRVSKAGQPDS